LAPAAIVEACGIWAASQVWSRATRNGWSPSTRGLAELPEPIDQRFGLGRLGLEALNELQTPHESKPLSFDVWRARPAPMLRVETPDPGLVKLGRFIQEPLRRERLTIDRLHVLYSKDT
jgi:hypothetical protein